MADPINYVYALVASEEDYFAEMAAVSAASLRAVMPSAHIVILSDEDTAALTTPAVNYIKDLASEWRSVSVDGDPVARSRYLAINARQLLDGHIVKLDADTLIARNLSKMVNHKHDLAGVIDIGGKPIPELDRLAQEQGWSYPSRYMNGGIYSVRDTDAARAFFQEVYKIWQDIRACGAYSDQLAINIALENTNFPISWLSRRYNAQISFNASFAFKPYIYHFFTGRFELRSDTVFHVLAHDLKSSGVFNENMLQEFLATRNPWLQCTQPRQHLALGRPVSAIDAWIRKSWRQCASHLRMR